MIACAVWIVEILSFGSGDHTALCQRKVNEAHALTQRDWIVPYITSIDGFLVVFPISVQFSSKEGARKKQHFEVTNLKAAKCVCTRYKSTNNKLQWKMGKYHSIWPVSSPICNLNVCKWTLMASTIVHWNNQSIESTFQWIHIGFSHANEISFESARFDFNWIRCQKYGLLKWMFKTE